MDFSNLSHWFTALYYTAIVFVTYLLIRFLISGRILFDTATRYLKQKMRDTDGEEVRKDG